MAGFYHLPRINFAEAALTCLITARSPALRLALATARLLWPSLKDDRPWLPGGVDFDQGG